MDEDNSVTVIQLLPGFAGSGAFVGHLFIFVTFAVLCALEGEE